MDQPKDKDSLRDFVPYPINVLDARQDGVITPSEYDLYMFLRHSVSRYGTINISFEGLTADLKHRGWKKNTITKLLGALNDKRFLHYTPRPGRGGTFKVLFPEIRTPTGRITRVPSTKHTKKQNIGTTTPQERPRLDVENPRLVVEKATDPQHISRLLPYRVPGSHIDTDNNKRNNRYLEVSPSQFRPQNYEEQRCKDIAIELEERSIGFLIGILRKHGYPPIEKAWGIYRHDVKKSAIRNPRKYFNKILMQVVEEQQV